MVARETEQGPDPGSPDSQALPHTALSLWESCHCLVEGTTKGQNYLFASQDAHKLPSIVLAAS